MPPRKRTTLSADSSSSRSSQNSSSSHGASSHVFAGIGAERHSYALAGSGAPRVNEQNVHEPRALAGLEDVHLAPGHAAPEVPVPPAVVELLQRHAPVDRKQGLRSLDGFRSVDRLDRIGGYVYGGTQARKLAYGGGIILTWALTYSRGQLEVTIDS
jgi:hypothetical protein